VKEAKKRALFQSASVRGDCRVLVIDLSFDVG
jgi:hypothetical protein